MSDSRALSGRIDGVQADQEKSCSKQMRILGALFEIQEAQVIRLSLVDDGAYPQSCDPTARRADGGLEGDSCRVGWVGRARPDAARVG